MQAHTVAYWNQYTKIFGPVINKCPTIRLNNRFTSTAGCCYPWEFRVDLGTKFLLHSKAFYNEMVRVTLPHELAHQIDYYLNGDPDGKWHRQEWKNIMVRIGQKPDRCHKMDLKTGIISE